MNPDYLPEAMTDLLHEIELLIRARYGLVRMDSDEDDRARVLLELLADRIGIPCFHWTPSGGLSRSDLSTASYDTTDFGKALAHIKAGATPGIYTFGLWDAGWAEKGGTLELLSDAADRMAEVPGAIVLYGDALSVPDRVRARSASIALPGPDSSEYFDLLLKVIADVTERQFVDIRTEEADLKEITRNLSGLTLVEAEKVLTKAVVEDQALSVEDIRHIVEAKKSIIERDGVLEYYPADDIDLEVAGLRTLDDWLEKRRKVVRNPGRAREFGLEFPKGILLVGIPGCGKSLSAKMVASRWRLPLLKLDPARLYNKYIGESERNLRRAQRLAEQMAPVVLWIDEIEKGFGQGGNDGGVSQRILGTFLSWMQERTEDIFVIATANDISKLPPEFLRKGRFDETFFVDLPESEDRAAIFRIHLLTRNQDPSRFDLRELAQAAEGFSGSEIEQTVVAALYTAFSEDEVLSQANLLRELSVTRPLSVTMAERVEELREWAAARAVFA